MVLRRCDQGHYYDSDKFAECPYCSLGKNVVEDETVELDEGGESTETMVGRKGSLRINNKKV